MGFVLAIGSTALAQGGEQASEIAVALREIAEAMSGERDSAPDLEKWRPMLERAAALSLNVRQLEAALYDPRVTVEAGVSGQTELVPWFRAELELTTQKLQAGASIRRTGVDHDFVKFQTAVGYDNTFGGTFRARQLLVKDGATLDMVFSSDVKLKDTSQFLKCMDPNAVPGTRFVLSAMNRLRERFSGVTNPPADPDVPKAVRSALSDVLPGIGGPGLHEFQTLTHGVGWRLELTPAKMGPPELRGRLNVIFTGMHKERLRMGQKPGEGTFFVDVGIEAQLEGQVPGHAGRVRLGIRYTTDPEIVSDPAKFVLVPLFRRMAMDVIVAWLAKEMAPVVYWDAPKDGLQAVKGVFEMERARERRALCLLQNDEDADWVYAWRVYRNRNASRYDCAGYWPGPARADIPNLTVAQFVAQAQYKPEVQTSSSTSDRSSDSWRSAADIQTWRPRSSDALRQAGSIRAGKSWGGN